MISAARTAFSVALACLPLAAQAQELLSPAPEMTTATYRAWTLRCAVLDRDDNPTVCEVAQTLALAQTGTPVAQIALGRLAADQPMKLVVQLPTGVWLPANVRLDAPDGAQLIASFTACGQLCAAEALPDESFVESLKSSQSAAKLTFQNDEQQLVELEVSPDGLAAALAAMETGTAAH